MTRVNLAKYRMDKAKEILIEAEDALKQKHFGMSVNRSYYAMFTSARALLALKELDSSKHSGVISLKARYPGIKFEFYKLCTKEYTEDWLGKIKEFYQWMLKKF